MKFEVYDGTASTKEKLLRVQLLKDKASNSLELISVDENGNHELFLLTIDDDGIILHGDCGGAGLPVDKFGRIKVRKQ